MKNVFGKSKARAATLAAESHTRVITGKGPKPDPAVLDRPRRQGAQKQPANHKAKQTKD